MPRAAWLFAFAPTLALATLWRSSPEALGQLGRIGAYWWMVPLSALVVSVAATGFSASRRGIGGQGRSRLVDASYLVSGPSLGVLGLTAFDPALFAAPAWTGGAGLVLALTSALLYFRATADGDGR